MSELTEQLTTLLFVLTGMMLTPIIFIALDFWAGQKGEEKRGENNV